jgi:hypothetical protein
MAPPRNFNRRQPPKYSRSVFRLLGIAIALFCPYILFHLIFGRAYNRIWLFGIIQRPRSSTPNAYNGVVEVSAIPLPKAP